MKELFENKTILITGGTGYLGKHLVEKLLEYNPHSIRVFSRDEVKHHKLQEMFNNNDKIRNLIGDVRDYDRLLKATRGADIVIHAAALKRLDILEYNVEESIKTNILGTLNVARACEENNVKTAVMVSTDKACNPVNTYGACKFVSERIFIESNYSKGSKDTKFICVRYGNVLESTGSVIPFFENKIKKKETIPLTDERMTRFIIDHNQAVKLIFDAIKYSEGGEVFVPKLPAFKIVDLIEILKEKHNSELGVKNIGIRPGEKIHEYMINSSEVPRTFEFGNYLVITSQIQEYNKKITPDYLDENNKLKNIDHYSSDMEVRDKEEIKSLFKEMHLL